MASKITAQRQGSGAGGRDTNSDGEHSPGGSGHTVSVKPGQQLRVLLGEFSPSDHARGFSIDLNPEPFPENSVETQIINTGTAKKERMVLFIANYGTRPVTAMVRQL